MHKPFIAILAIALSFPTIVRAEESKSSPTDTGIFALGSSVGAIIGRFVANHSAQTSIDRGKQLLLKGRISSENARQIGGDLKPGDTLAVDLWTVDFRSRGLGGAGEAQGVLRSIGGVEQPGSWARKVFAPGTFRWRGVESRTYTVTESNIARITASLETLANPKVAKVVVYRLPASIAEKVKTLDLLATVSTITALASAAVAAEEAIFGIGGHLFPSHTISQDVEPKLAPVAAQTATAQSVAPPAPSSEAVK